MNEIQPIQGTNNVNSNLANVNRGSASPRPGRNLRPGCRRRALLHRRRRRYTCRNRRRTRTPLSLNADNHLTLASELKANRFESTEVVAGGDGAADAAGRADGPQLVELTVVLVPDLVGAAVGFKVAVAGAVGVVGGMVNAEGFHHVVLLLWGVVSGRVVGTKEIIPSYRRTISPAIKSQISVRVGSRLKCAGVFKFAGRYG